MSLNWSKDYEIGITIIDEQHQRFVATLSKLIDIVEKGANNKEEMQIVFTGIEDYAKYHFATEEKYFKEFNYTGAQEHINEHEKFKLKFNEVKIQYLNDTIAGTFNLTDFLEDWLLNHLNKLDKKYVPCFKDHGL